jgi:hypothetical protein
MNSESNTKSLEEQLKTMRTELTASKMGHLARRIEMLVRDAEESILLYGSKAIVGKNPVGGESITFPVETTATMSVTIRCNGHSKDYSFTVGPTGHMTANEAALLKA